MIYSMNIVNSIRKELKKSADRKSREGFQNFFKEKARFYGVKAAGVSRIFMTAAAGSLPSAGQGYTQSRSARLVKGIPPGGGMQDIPRFIILAKGAWRLLTI